MAREPERPPRGTPTVTTFVFRVRNMPAALYKAMGGFATNGVNMTKLESYMVDGEFAATQFYADVEAHPEDRPVALALEELAFFSREVKILSVYRPIHCASPPRRAMRTQSYAAKGRSAPRRDRRRGLGGSPPGSPRSADPDPA